MTVKKIVGWGYLLVLAIILFLILLRDVHLAGNVWWGYWQSETSIGIWMARGYTSSQATLIAILLGNFADINWWLIVFFVLDSWRPARKAIAAFWQITPAPMELASWKYRLRYVAIPIVSFIPNGGVWASLMLAKFMRLNKWGTLAAVLVGNTAKNVAWGGFFVFLAQNPFLKRNIGYAAVTLSLFATMFTTTKIVKKLRSRRAKTAVLLLLQPVLKPEE